MKRLNTRRVIFIILILVNFSLLAGGDTSPLVTLKRFRFYLGEPILKPILRLIKQADKSITVGMYHIVGPKYPAPRRFAEALVDAHNRGIDVRVAIERRDQWTWPTVRYFQKKGVKVRFYEADKVQHVKAIVIDEEFVFTGSQNISESALKGRNWETGVIFRSPKIAAKLKKYLRHQK